MWDNPWRTIKTNFEGLLDYCKDFEMKKGF